MAAADTLLYALRVPRQIVIHHKGAELEIDEAYPIVKTKKSEN